MSQRSYYKRLILQYCAFALSLCVSLTTGLAEGVYDYLTEEELYGDIEEQPTEVRDPLESVNRLTFKFNDFIYMNVVKHIAEGYQNVTPDAVERGASNFFKNLGYPVRLAGNLLQGRIKGGWLETERFAVNTTLGVVGVFPAANRFDRLQPLKSEDIGQALGAWGMGEGPYLMLPLLGPSNLRDLFGLVGDRTVNPLKEPYSVIGDSRVQTALGVSDFVVKSPTLMRTYSQMKDGAVDPYSSMKNGYSQMRRAMIQE
ncbi:MAG: VacJ family lipoprotein [Opitutae bacterium]|nr:VacJ family lipoprotein [Opitutae bacterium]